MVEFSDLRLWSVVTGVGEIIGLIHMSSVFPTLESVMRRENYFSGDTEDQMSIKYAQLYSLVFMTAALAKVFSNAGADLLGIWMTRTVVNVVTSLGLICLLIATPDNPWPIWFGYPAFYGGSTGLIYGFIILQDLYPKHRAKIMSLVSMSSAVVYAIYIGYQHMSQPKIFFAVLLGIQVLVFIRTFVFMPKRNSVFTYCDDSPTGRKIELGWKTRHQKRNFGDSSQAASDGSKWLKCLVTPSQIILYLFMFFLDIRSMTYASQMQSWFIWITEDDPAASTTINQLSDAYLYCSIGQVISAAVLGFLQDKTAQLIDRRFGVAQKAAQMASAIIFMSIAACTYVIASLLQTIQNSGWQVYLVFILMSSFTGLRYNCRNIYMKLTVPSEWFGRVFAICNLLQFATSFLPAPITTLTVTTFHGNYATTYYILSGLGLCSVVLPFLLFYTDKGKFARQSKDLKGVANAGCDT